MALKRNSFIFIPLFILLGIAIGVFIGSRFSLFDKKNLLYKKLDNVVNLIAEEYVDSIDIEDLIEEALPQIINSLDPHSEYFSAEDMKSLSQDLEGHFSGVGVNFYMKDDSIVIMRVIKGGPSEAAGLIPGDRIIKANDSIIVNKNLDNEKVKETLCGESGSIVKLDIFRPSIDDTIQISVVRSDIHVESIDASFMIEDEIGYIKINSFNNVTFSEFISSISKLKAYGCKSSIIDLRGNTGGSMDAANAIINEYFPDETLIMYAEGRSFPRLDIKATGNGTCQNDDLVILIDEMSASSSEIFAGAVQDNDRGVIIGRQSFGKGLVQNQRVFDDGSGIRLTVARYYTPSGRSPQRKYEKGQNEEYQINAYNRYFTGETIKDEEDGEKVEEYKTVGGRTITGGEGITPDILMKRDSTGINSYFIKLIDNDFINRYAVLYTDKNRDKLNTFNDFDSLYVYLNKQPLLLNLISYADHYGQRRRPYLINESAKRIEKILYANIIQYIMGSEGFHRVVAKDDDVVNKAIEIIKKGYASPKSVREEKYKQR